MKKLLLLLLLSMFTLSLWAGSGTINSVETLKAFMIDGQKMGYFPKTIPIGFPMSENKLMAIDLDFRRVIHWNMNTRCPNSEDQIILALGNKNHSIVCNRGDTAGVLGDGDDWVDDATGNDIYYPGGGDDIVDVGSGNDILIFEEGWGHDTVTMSSRAVDTTKILGYDGSYPWTYTDFIIFGKSVKRSDIVWIGSTLYDLKTGDTIALNTKSVNILFAGEKKQDSMYLPTRVKLELTDIAGESIVDANGLLYIAKGNKGLQVVDTKDPEMLMQLSKVVLPGRALSIVLKDKIAYVAQGDFYLEGKRGWVSIVDIHDPSRPKLLKTLKFGTTIKCLSLHDEMLYIASTHYWMKEKRHLYVYDVHNKSEPKIRAKVKLKDHISSMAYFKGYIYYVTSHNRLKRYAVSKITEPNPIAFPVLKDKKVMKLMVQGDLVFFHEKYHRLSLYKGVSDGTLKQYCDFQTLVGPPKDDFVSQNAFLFDGDLLFKAEGKFGITVSSISQCRTIAHLPLKKGEKPWPTKLTMVGKYLISYREGPKAKVYTFKKGKLYRVHPAGKQDVPREVKSMSQDQLQTALYDAALHGNSAEVKRLLGMGANPNIKGHEQATPIEIAARVGEVNTLEAMLKGGGKPSRRAMMLAALTEKDKAIKLLERYGVPVTVKDRGGCSTLHYIAQDGSLEMVKYLVKKRVPYNGTCRKGETPLTWANYGNNCAVIDYLEGLYPKTYKHQENKVCAKRKVEAELARIQREKELAEKKKYEKFINGKGYYFEPINIKLKVKQKKKILNIKMLIHNPMLTVDQAKRLDQPQQYITHVMITLKEQLLLDMTLSPRISKNPIFKAKFVYLPRLETKPLVHVQDNIGFSVTKAANKPHGVDSEPYKVNTSLDYSVLKPDVWSAKTIDSAIRAFYGDVRFDPGDFNVVMPKLAANGGSVPMHIESNLALESMLVISEGNSKKALIAFHIPKGQKPNYDFKIKVKEYGEHIAVVVAKGRDGKYYIAQYRFEVSGPPTCDGS